jgi:hypothetical protein
VATHGNRFGAHGKEGVDKKSAMGDFLGTARNAARKIGSVAACLRVSSASGGASAREVWRSPSAPRVQVIVYSADEAPLLCGRVPVAQWIEQRFPQPRSAVGEASPLS